MDEAASLDIQRLRDEASGSWVWVSSCGIIGKDRLRIYFGHDQASKYSCLIFVNRGMGESDEPVMRYSTSEMAKDAFELLDRLGWAGERSIHVVGISMGGMIAQEMVHTHRGI